MISHKASFDHFNRSHGVRSEMLFDEIAGSCADTRATPRSTPQMIDEQFEKLIMLSCSPEAERLEQIGGKKKEAVLPKSRGWYRPKEEGAVC